MKAKEIIAAIIGIAGMVILCCEADTIGTQAINALIGFGCWGVAWAIYSITVKVERRNHNETAKATTVEKVYAAKSEPVGYQRKSV